MKRLIAAVAALLLIPAVSVKASGPPELSAVSAILMDAESGRVLFEQNVHEKRDIASITKLMTALVAVRSGHDLSEEVTIHPEWTGIEGSSIYLRSGETVTLETLLYGLLLNSGNDAAIAAAAYCGGSVERFVEQMNQWAQRLGMKNSQFANPNGLSEEGHYSTAYDMALLAAACIRDETVARIVSTRSITLGTRTFTNHNKLLWRYEGCIGMKTGYTDAAGRTLVSGARRNDMTLIAVTLNAPNDWSDHTKLFDYGFEHYSRQSLCVRNAVFGQIPVQGGLVRFLPAVIGSDRFFPLAEGEKITTEVTLNYSVNAPVEKGERLGLLSFYLNGEWIGETELLAGGSVYRDIFEPQTWKDGLRAFLKQMT